MDELKSREKEQLLQSLAQKSSTELVEILCQLLLAEGDSQDQPVGAGRPALKGDFDSFTEFMEDSLRQYRFPELRRFRVEGKRVFLMFHDQEIEIKAKMESLGKAGLPQASPGASQSAQQAGPAAGKGEKKAAPGSVADNARFKNLEL